MKPTCERCGRTLAALDTEAPGAPAGAATCTCGYTPAIALAASAPGKPGRDAPPLPSPREGSLEVDPWSLPPPEDGYENLVLDDGPAAAAPSAPEEAPEPRAGGATPLEAATAEAAEAGDATPAAPSRRSRAIVAIAAAAAVLVVAVVALIVRGRSAPADAAGGTVRVTVTQEIPWLAPPPLAPADPSFRERARPDPAPARPALPPPSPRSAAATAPPARARGTASAEVAPPPALVAAAPESDAPSLPPPEPVAAAIPEAAPAAAAAAAGSAAIPLPPPPVLPEPQAVPAQGAAPAGKGRAPVLQTRACVEDALRIPRGLESRLPREVVLQVQVGEDGRAADVKFPGGVDPRLATALTAAVRTCRFAPGAGADGRPATVPATMRVRFEP